MKLLYLALCFALSITTGVFAQSRTLRVVKAVFTAASDTQAQEVVTDPEVDYVSLECMIEEDDLGFRFRLDASDLEHLLTDVLSVSVLVGDVKERPLMNAEKRSLTHS